MLVKSARAQKAGESLRSVAGDAGKKAGEVIDDAKKHYDRASQVYDTGAKFTRASAAARSGLLKARDWIKANPGKAAAVSFSLVLGVRMGAALPGVDAVLLALIRTGSPFGFAIFGIRKLGESLMDICASRKS